MINIEGSLAQVEPTFQASRFINREKNEYISRNENAGTLLREKKKDYIN